MQRPTSFSSTSHVLSSCFSKWLKAPSHINKDVLFVRVTQLLAKLRRAVTWRNLIRSLDVSFACEKTYNVSKWENNLF